MKWKILVSSMAAIPVLVLFSLTLSHLPEDCLTGSPCGPYNFGSGIADMAYDHTRGLFYQVEVGSPGGIFAWNPVTCSLACGPCSPVPWSQPQRGIAYRPDEDVIYAGGWDEGIIYKMTPPPNCELIDTFNINWHPYLANISGLAWDDDYGGLFIASRSMPNYLGKIDFESKELIWDSPLLWSQDTTCDTSCAGLSYTAGYLASVNTSQMSVEFFLNPEFDESKAETCCFLPDDWSTSWGVGFSEGLIPWVANAPNYLNYPLSPLVDSVPRVMAWIVLPNDSDVVFDTVQIMLVDNRAEIETISRALFEYSRDGITWFYIGDDYDGTDEAASSVGPDTTVGDGWSGYWSTKMLSKGWHYVRGTFFTESGLVSSDTISVFVDPSPPIPAIYYPDFEGSVCDSAEICFTLRDTTDIDSVVINIVLTAQDYEKGVPTFDQHDFETFEAGEEKKYTKCGPVAAVSCLRYWSVNGSPKLGKFPNSEKVMNDEQMVAELADKKADMHWKKGKGVKWGNFVRGIKQYLRVRNCIRDFKVETADVPDLVFKWYQKELDKKKEDVILMLKNPTGAKAHYLVGNSLKKENKITKTVDFMDPWDGKLYWTKWERGKKQISYGFPKGERDREEKKICTISHMLSVSPKKLPDDMVAPKIRCDCLIPVFPMDSCYSFSTEPMEPGEMGFLEVQVYEDDRIYEDYVTIVKSPCDTNKLEIGQIEPGVNPGQTLDLPVFMKNPEEVGGFKFFIEYDPTVLTFLDVKRGEIIDDFDGYYDEYGHSPRYLFEYFQHRMLPCVQQCETYKIKVVGIADMPDGHEGHAITPRDSQEVLFYVTFKVANDANLKGFKTPVKWEWDDSICTENVKTDPTGTILYVSADTTQFNPDECDTTGPNTQIVRNIHFIDGGIRIREDGLTWIGDININQYPYEIADAVLFANYFLYGEEVFQDEPYWRDIQINATDVNQDGFTLSMSDFVFLIRIILEDISPKHKLVPSTDLVDVALTTQGDRVKVVGNSNSTIGAGLYVFRHSGEVKNLRALTDMNVKYHDADGELRVLVYSFEGKAISAGVNELFSFEAKDVELVEVEAADVYGSALKSTTSTRLLPTRFALMNNYPNPFNLSTSISFALPTDSEVSLKLYNVAGQLVKSFEGIYAAGTHRVTWDGTNAKGEKVASGIYFYRLVAGDFTETKKMLLVK